MIRLGVCTSVDNAVLLKEAGFDYIELGMSSTAALSEEEFEILLWKVKASPLPVESMNAMLPGTFTLCSEEGTGDEIRAYLQKAFDRAELLGVKVVVFGSGQARTLPEGMSEEEGYACLAAYLRVAGPIAAAHHMQIAIEPLRAVECNIINHVDEAQKLAALADLPNVAALADLYHMMQGNESMDALEKGVIHCHIADNASRSFPVKGDGSDTQYEAFFTALKKSHYDGRVSIEGKAPEDLKTGAALSYALLDQLRR